MLKRITYLLFIILLPFSISAQISLHGTIHSKTGEPLVGVIILFPELGIGTVTDNSGNYSINKLPKKKLEVEVSFINYKKEAETIDLSEINQKDFVLEESVTEITEVLVHGHSNPLKMLQTPTPISIVTQTDLLQKSSTNIIDALASQPGISQITTGSGISKPVIRGLGYNRVVIVNDDVRQEGQQWGDEHGIEIDEAAVYSAEILKGPASLLYGSDAMAGVISFFSAPTLPEGKMKLNLMTDYQTNNGLIAYSADFAGHKKDLIWDLRYSNKQAHAYQNRYDGYVFNSGFSENAISGLIGLNKSWGYSHLSLSAYQLIPGMIEGYRDSLTGNFTKPVALSNNTAGESIATQSDFISYEKPFPYQVVNHYKVVWNNNILMGSGTLKTTLGYQQNRRQEFGDILNPNNYCLYFQLHTVNYDIHYLLPQNNGFGISFGINGMYQNSLNLGSEYLVPEYRLFDIGGFIIAKKKIGNVDISGGLRIDNRFETADALYLKTSGEKTTSTDISSIQRFNGFKTNFPGFSGSVGASYQIDENWNSKLNLSKGFRAPSINELSSNGVHEGTIRYEIGNPNLKPESSLQIDYELGFESEHISSKLNLFMNFIDNYIFSSRLPGKNGNDSIIDNFPAFKFSSGNARIMGGEFSIDIHPHPQHWLHFENSFSYVNSQLLNQPDSTRYLPLTPAPKWKSDIRIDIHNSLKTLKNLYFLVGIEHNFAQNNIYSAYNTETPTPAYTLLNASLGTDVVTAKRMLFSVYINGSNLTNEAYQSHLSRLKYAPENLVTGHEGVFNIGRNLSIKVIIPVEL
ncbi:MAG: TonB-dependent receptor [Paludibacter sp.]